MILERRRRGLVEVKDWFRECEGLGQVKRKIGGRKAKGGCTAVARVHPLVHSISNVSTCLKNSVST